MQSSGWLLVILGLIHIAVWLVSGGAWEGAVSWRKPILFGISTGLTLLSFAWIYTKLKPRVYDRISVPMLAFSLVIEVALITLQQWRGVPSHFNNSTSLDAAVDFWMILLISVASVVLIDLSVRCFVGLKGNEDTKLAIRSGVTFLVLSIAIGFAISFYGQHQFSTDKDPGKYGNAGVTKFPHGVAIHAIQLFPAITLLLQKMGANERARVRFLKYATLAIATLLTFSLWQTLAGYARFQPNTIGAILLMFTFIFGAKGTYEAFKR